MARIKPQALLLQSKKKKGPTRISLTTIVTCNLLVILIVLSLYATYKHWYRRSSLQLGTDFPNFERSNAFGESKKFDLPSYAVLNTAKGLITVELYKDASPGVVNKFIDLCQKGYFKGMPFHCVIKNYVIQGGDLQRLGAAEDWTLKAKPHSQNAISPKHEAFMLGTTKSKSDIKEFELFITTAPIPDLNDKLIVFGRVIKGEDVVQVEKLIKELPSSAPDWSSTDTAPVENGGLSNDNSLQHLENGMNLRETQSILLERIGSEMNRLKFYISHAKNLPFIENMEKRIQSATLLLDGSLGHCYVNPLEHRDANAIYNCLRAYAAVDNTTAAEELFRTTIVSPLIQKIIQHSHSEVVGGDSSDELDRDYQQIMQCIEKDCKFLLDISSSANLGLHVFDFLANSILKEVLFAIQKGKPGAFSPGRPTEFLKNYKSSLSFLAYLEGYCPSRTSVATFRSETVYVDFMRQWNIGVYFSLRFQEIAGALDSTLMVATITPFETFHGNQGKHQKLTWKQSVTLLESLRSCWSEDVLVLSCSDKFLRLSLQLLSRYTSWLSDGLAARKARGASSNPIPNSEWATAADVADFIYVINDVGFLVTELTGNYLGHILQLLESSVSQVLDLVKQSVLQAAKSLEDLLPTVKDTMIESIVEKSVEDLRQLKGITATYRMTNKLPVRHSPYVSGILRPLRVFLNGERVAYLSKDIVNELVLGSAERITAQYYELASDLVSVARKTESSLLRLRQGAQRRVGASSDALDNNISDTDKICMQLFLDIQEYGRNLTEHGVAAADIPAFRSLWQCVAPEERQTQIVF